MYKRLYSAGLLFLTATFLSAAADLRLLDAVKRRDHQAAEALVKERAGVNAAQPDGATALAWAVHLDDAKIAGLLLAAGADVNAAGKNEITALGIAIERGDQVMADRLRIAGAITMAEKIPA